MPDQNVTADLRASNQALREALETAYERSQDIAYCYVCQSYLERENHGSECWIPQARAALAADARREGLDTAQGEESRDGA